MSDIQKKKIIFCGAKTYPAGIGGIETHLFYLVPEIAKAGFDAHVITGKEERGQPDYEMVNGVHMHRVFSLKVPVLRKLSMSLGIHEIVEKINPDIIHAHDTVTSYAAVKHFGNRCRVVCTAHGVNHLRPDWKFPVKNYLKVMEHQIY
ncbi:MAG: glycosyltransferase family 4 protein, partial [Thermoplasmata archaeon]